MVFFSKRTTPPPSLANQKSCTDPDIIQALAEDFKNKCYICGDKYPTALNVEHFEEHGNDPKKIYDWNNLFYACEHCNHVKNDTFRKGNSNLLNCTDVNQKVDLWIMYQFHIDSKLKATVKFIPNPWHFNPTYNTQRDNTIKLLDNVFNGTNGTVRKQESANLTEKLQDEVLRFEDKLLKYKQAKQPLVRDKLRMELMKMAASDAPFAAFKRWIIRREKMSGEIPFLTTETNRQRIILLNHTGS